MEAPRTNYKLQIAREQRMLTQEEVAEKLGIDTQTYWRWEHYEQWPRKYSLRNLCDLFGVSPRELGFERLPVDDGRNSPRAEMVPDVKSVSVSQHLPERVLPTSEPTAESSVSELFEIGIRALSIVSQQEQWSAGEIHRRIDQAFMKYDKTERHQEKKTISRRDALLLVIGLPGALLGVDFGESGSPLLAEETLSLCVSAIPACYSLVYAGDVQQVEQALPTYLNHLTSIAHTSSHHRQLAASLASQGYKLANLLDLRREDFSSALQHIKEAQAYGQIAQDPNLLVASLIEEALTLWYRKRPTQALATYKTALPYINDISPILRGRVYVGLAEATARMVKTTKSNELEQEALQYIGLARDTFPDRAESDPNFAYTHYSRYYLHLYEGLMYANLDQPDHALAAYARFDTPEYASRRLEMSGREAAALLLKGEMEHCSAKIEVAVTSALALNSDLRYSEALDVYQGMQLKWPHESRVKGLAELFQR